MEYPTYGHGTIDVVKALATSCNIYFHELGVKVGIDNIDLWAKRFGLGEYTGIELPWENKGIRANRQTKKELRNDEWRPADTAQTAIGQFDMLLLRFSWQITLAHWQRRKEIQTTYSKRNT